ncbi:hypothetical protein A1O1_08455 [Capronia coronata CBS 617.96]|uniref:Zn(2)-C6 fungal-type domain-containing protein n=1 Tax=Capronia coronata CBS 617.96 TaxID=1182541 RepID=W9XJD4_9EURO|nr:uncharacterized protein A1O1_08455 [Capronia coronata CBS 617.96]EXJ80313.1 hypothetical protein A1O1_08455 [Capronia coronata CBS 617.96]
MHEEDNNPADLREESNPARNHFYGDPDALNMPGLGERVDSSPNFRDMGSEGSPLSAAEKRRNKLGYHRTAVACGHCRRRKIRCMPAFDDPVGRCQNCIRLKKDCHFFPVDQQTPGSGRRVRSGTKSTEGGLNEAETPVPSSSPGGVLRSASFEHFDQMDGPLGTPPLSRNSPGYTGFHLGPGSVSGSGFDYTSPYDYRQHAQTQLAHQHQHQQQQFYPQYGHSSQGPYPSAFIAGSMPANLSTISRESTYEYQPSSPVAAYGWAQSPTRSMSMGERENSPQSFHAAYRTQTYPSIERRIASDMQHLSSTSSRFMPMTLENQPGAALNFSDPMPYQPLPVEMQQEWAGPEQRPQLASSSGAPTPVWYPQQSGLTDAGDVERSGHLLPSQHQNPH